MKKQVSFQTYSYFYKNAQQCTNKENFIEDVMSLDYNDWAIGYSAEEINDILNYIYQLAHCSIAALREKLGLTKVAMADIYITSKRTLLAWEKGERQISDMDRLLISYTVFTDVSYAPDSIYII